MAGKIIEWLKQKSLAQAIVLSFVSATIWLWGYCLFLFARFHGGVDGLAGSGSELLDMLFAWAFAMWVSWFVSRQLCQKWWGYINRSGFIFTAIFVLPAYVVCGAIASDYFEYNTRVAGVFNKLFCFLGLFGILPEGKLNSAPIDVVYYIVIFIIGVIGYYYSARKIQKALVLISLISISFISNLYSFDTVVTHQQITTNAISLLNSESSIAYLEIIDKAEQIRSGTVAEDEYYKFRTHFYRPTDTKGLWGVNANALERLTGQDNIAAHNFPEEAVALYKGGNKDNAYKALGHIVHLASQDMFAVPHIFDDPHLIATDDYLNFAKDSFEPWVQNNAAKIWVSPFAAATSISDVTWPPTTALHRNAVATYKAVRIAGELIKEGSAHASGALHTMFPDIVYAENVCKLWDTETNTCSDLENVWTIPNYGDCYESGGLQGNPGLHEDWWLTQNFLAGSADADPDESTTKYFYIENPSIAYPAFYKYGDPAYNKSLSELWALDKERLIAKSQAATAGIFRAFAQAVDQVHPSIELRENDGQGAIIPANGVAGPTAYVKTQDPSANDPGGDTNYPTPSGLYKLELKNLGTGTITSYPPPPIGINTSPITLNDLADGNYQFTAYDGLGNVTSVNFKVLDGGSFSVLRASNDQAIAAGGFAAEDSIYVTGAPGTARIVLDGSWQQEVTFAPGDNVAAEFDYLGDGAYTVSAYDADNNLLNTLSFTNDTSTPWFYMTDGSDNYVSFATSSTIVNLSAEDSGSGIDRIVLEGPSGATRIENGQSSANEVFSGLAAGQYTIWVYDRSGNTAHRAFWIASPTPPAGNESQPELENTGTIAGDSEFHYTDISRMASLSDGSRYIAGSGVEGNAPQYCTRNDTACWYGVFSSYLLKVNASGTVVWRQYWPATYVDDPYNWTQRDYYFLNVLGLGADGDGNAYMLVFDERNGVNKPSVQRFLPNGGSTSVDLPITPAEEEYVDDGSLAVDSVHGRIYASYMVYSYINWRYEYKVACFDANLNLLNVRNINTDMGATVNPVGTVFTDGLGDVWTVGLEGNRWAGNSHSVVLRYSQGLNAETKQTSYDMDTIVGADPRGGIILSMNDALWHVTASGSGIPSIVPSEIIPEIPDSSGYLYGFVPDDNTAVKLGDGNSSVWNPPHLNLNSSTNWIFGAMAIPSTGKLDVSGCTYIDAPDVYYGQSCDISVSRYAPAGSLFNSISNDGLVVLNSPIADATVSSVEPNSQITPLAAAAGGGLVSASSLYTVTASTVAFESSAQLTIEYSNTLLAEKGLSAADIAVYEFAADTGWSKLTTLGIDTVGRKITAAISHTSRVYGLFGTSSTMFASVLPSSGPIGMPFTIAGSGFGTYSSGITTVLIGGTTAPISLWNSTTIKGTIPGSLAAGEHAVAVMRGTTTIANAAPFIVTTPALYALTPSSGAIGVPFVITGESFGNYVANNTRVLLGGTTAPLTLWTDTRIQGTIPGSLAPGDNEVVVERELNGGVVRTSSATFTVITPVVTEVTPSSGAIGVPFTITGANFGNYVANYTKVLIGGATAPLSLWTETRIQGTIPGGLAAGDYELVVQRELNGGITATAPVQFKVVTPTLLAIIPSSGSIGVGFTLTGANFGNYVANYTRVLIGGATAPLSLWTDGLIKGTVPGSLVSGTYDVAVERELNGGLVRTSTVSFTLVAPTIAAVAPSSGAIGVPFTITGASFGNYVANYTKVLIGGATAPVSLWTDTKIQGTIPGGLTPGDYDLIVARELNGGVVTTQPVVFKVLAPELAAITPSSGAIGVPFVITGASFGNYVANYTRVLIGGATAPLSLWTDTKIQGTIPGGLTGGDNEVVVERALNGGVVRSSTFTFTVLTPEVASVMPSSGPIGMPFVINGASFGNYVANYTRVLIGSATAPLSLWTDTKIQGTIPGGLAAGDYEVVVVRNLNGGEVRTSTAAFTVTVPVINAVNPSTAAVMASFTISGASFGNYVANNTRVLINGATMPLTLWTDTKIQGKLPFLLNGTYPVQVQRSLNGGLAESGTAYITVAEPVISSMTPASGAVGTVFNLYGTSFGPYDASQTRVTIGGAACALSLWTDTNIRGTVPAALSYGTYTVVAMRGQALSNELEYTVPEPFRVSMARPVSMLDAEFKLGEVYVYPNPAKAGKVPVFHVEVGLADSVKIKVFSVSGQSVLERTITGVPQAVDGKYAYEYAWEGRIASGVYFYTMEAERAGKKLKAKGKFAVVR